MNKTFLNNEQAVKTAKLMIQNIRLPNDYYRLRLNDNLNYVVTDSDCVAVRRIRSATETDYINFQYLQYSTTINFRQFTLLIKVAFDSDNNTIYINNKYVIDEQLVQALF